MNIKSAFRSFHLLQWLAFLVAAVVTANPAVAAPDNQGREFVLGFMDNYLGGGSIDFYLTAPQATTVTVQGSGFGPQTYQVQPDSITTVVLPVSLRASASGTIEDKGLVLSADEEFVVYGLNQIEFSTDAFLGLPTDIAGTEYLVPSFSNAKKTLPSELLIVAQEDGTDIVLTPRVTTIGGQHVKQIKARKSAQFSLNRLQSIQFQAKGGTSADLTGSVITSNKPISVFAGHQCGVVPRKAVACDHLVEQIPPTNTWGDLFLTTPLATRNKGDVFRVLAANDGTIVELDGKRVAKLKRGAYKQIDLASGSYHQIKTSGPALVAQYSKSKSADLVDSDPFMMLITPTEQFGSNYLVSTPGSDPVAFNNYLNIVAPTGTLSDLRLDDNAITAPFSPIGPSGFSGAQIPVEIGTHSITHLLPNVSFGVYLYGFAPSDSYGYSGGNREANIADAGGCSPTETVPGDGIDNDCDHKIDEELLNRVDDDGDGKIDEDLAKEITSISANAGGPYTVDEGGSIVLNGSADSAAGQEGLAFAWDFDNAGTFATTGATPAFAGTDGPSTHKATLRVTGVGVNSEADATITVNNVAPTVAAGSDVTLIDGVAFSQSGSFTDPGADAWNATVDYGDGSGVQPLVLNGKTFSLDHRFSGNGPYTVTVTVTDDDGGSGSDSLQVSINNTAPTVDAGPDATLNVGAPFTQAGSFSDPDSNTWTATVDYGDGSGSLPLTLDGKTFNLAHNYTGTGPYTVTVTVTDGEGSSGSDSVQIGVNVAPIVNAGPDATLNVGAPFTQAGSFTDPDSSTWTATVDYGDDSGISPLTLDGKTFNLAHNYTGTGPYTVTVTVTDGEGSSGSDSVQIGINQAPIVNAGPDATLNLGAPFTQAGSFSDPDSSAWTATVDYGDDSGLLPLTLDGKTFNLAHNYEGTGPYTVTVTVTDGEGSSGSDSVQIGVNVAPIVNAGPDATLNVGAPFTQAGSFSDPDSSAWTATVDYGDGSGSLPLTLDGKTFSLAHNYEGAGPYTVTVTVTDGEGSSGSDSVQIGVNVAPIVNAGPDATLNLGAPFTQAGSFSDPDSNTWTATVDYGDGSGSLPLTLDGKTFSLAHNYEGTGPYTVTVTVTDGEGSSGSDSVQIGVNVAPIVNAGPDATLNVGALFTQAGSFSDPDSSAWTATVDYGDDSGLSPLTLDGKTFNLAHNYEGTGPYTVTVTVTDGEGSSGSDSVQIGVNVAPIVNAGPDATLNVGAPFTQAGSFTDPDSSTWTATVDYGDGSGAQPLTLDGKAFNLAHNYTGTGPYTVTVTVTDGEGSPGSDTAQIGVNVAPIVNAGPDATLNLGALFTQAGSFSDPDSNTWTATVDYGDGSGAQPLTLDGKSFNLAHNYEGAGPYTVTVTVTDDNGASGSDSVQLAVNVAPIVNAGPDATLNEGSTFTQAGSFIDPDSSAWTATVDYDDGSGILPLTLIGKTFNLAHNYEGAGPYTVKVTVTDGEGGIGSDTVQVTFVNVVPIVDAGKDIIVNEGSTFSQSGSFTDPGTGPWFATVDYGDGFSGQSLVLSGKNFTLEHAYSNNGVYTITVSLVDNNGGTGTDTVNVTVNNVAPIVDAGKDALLNGSVNGTQFVQTGSFIDPGADSWTATVDYGDDSSPQPLGLNGKSFTLNHTYFGSGIYNVTVTVDDHDGGIGTDIVQVTVNDPPIVNAGLDATLNEGSAFSQAGSFSDLDSSFWIATVDYGDGSGVHDLILDGTSFALIHTYLNNGNYTVTVKVTDDNGNVGSDTVQIQVFNVAPRVAGINVQSSLCSQFIADGSFVDPGADAWTATVNYGDNTGDQPLTLNGKTFTLEHAFSPSTSPIFNVTVTVTDSDGDSGSNTTTIQCGFPA